MHPIERMTDSDVRAACRERLEALEHWLRRLIDESLTPIYGDYFSHVDENGNRLIRHRLSQQVETRQTNEPQRYPRKVDAILLEDAVEIICKPELFKQHFRSALNAAYPDGREEARTFLTRLLVPRNNLAHANAISLRQAEQIICYTNDVIDSLKTHYRTLGMQQTYDVPLILKLTDSFGNVFTRGQFDNVHDGGIMRVFCEDQCMHLRPGDTLTLEIEVDPAYEPDTYIISWTSSKPWSREPSTGTKVVIPIANKQVGQQFDVHCRLTSKKDWHRMSMGTDDFLLLYYKVLPPIN